VLVLRTGMLARWVGWAGLVASFLYLFNHGDVLATAVPGFPLFELADFLGSSLWGLWVIALTRPWCELRSVASPPTR